MAKIGDNFTPLGGDYKTWAFKYAINKNGEILNLLTNKILKSREGKNGYLYITLIYKQIREYALVHRLVLNTFVGKPKLDQQTNHKNGIKSDNRLCNLEWVTCKENQRHKQEVLNKQPSNETHVHCKYSNKLIMKARKLFEKYTFREVAEKTGIPITYIKHILYYKARKL